jgi:hypothetical protein
MGFEDRIPVEVAKVYAGEVAKLSEAYHDTILSLHKGRIHSVAEYLEVSLPPENEGNLDPLLKGDDFKIRPDIIKDLRLKLESFYLSVPVEVRSHSDISRLVARVAALIKNP